ncbi:MAG: hypothetical protein Q9218_006524 [Villophora microphyllina]
MAVEAATRDSHILKTSECINARRSIVIVRNAIAISPTKKLDKNTSSKCMITVVASATEPSRPQNGFEITSDRPYIATTAEDLKNHQHAKGHHEKGISGLQIERERANIRSNDPPVEASHFRCIECERDFTNEQALAQHLRDKKTHHPPELLAVPSEDGSYHCGECDRNFQTAIALKQHLESLIHHPLSKLECLASPKCKARFASPSAFLHHLESGACKSGLTRAKLDKLIQSQDTDHIITFGTQKQALLGSATGDWMSFAMSDSGLLTPSSHGSDTYIELGGPPSHLSDPGEVFPASQSPLPVTIRAGKLSCPLCPKNSKGFRNFQALQNHLSSPAHAPNLYHCPVNLMPATAERKKATELIKEFSTFSGMTQHIESGSCKGGKKMLEGAIGFVQEKLKALGFKDVRLLN